MQLHDAAQKYTHKVKARASAADSPKVTKDDQSDLYFVNPEGEFLASYGPEASSKDVGREWAGIIKVRVSVWHPQNCPVCLPPLSSACIFIFS